MPTLEEIARLSSVSRSTVSRVVNESPNVSEETRAKVLAVVKQLDYQPNAVARSLAAGCTRILGLIVPSGVTAMFHDPFFPVFIPAVTSACSAHGYSVMLWLAELMDEERMIRQVLRNGLLDGVIVFTIHLSAGIISEVVASNLPYVLIGQHSAQAPDAAYVDVENRGGARQVVMHLLRKGYRRIAHIAGPTDTVCAQHRIAGYRDALGTWRRRIDEDLVVAGDFTEARGYEAMKELLPRRPEAVFAGNDMMALGALRACRDSGVRVPQDMAVVGFDDISLSAKSNPPLTTVRQPSDRMGIAATEMLLDILETGDAIPRQIVLPTELVIRQSCGTTAGL